MLIEFGKANWVQKARQQPDKVRMVLEKVRTDGFAATFESVQAKLDQPVTPGYSNAGVVVDTGRGVDGFRIGDRVVSNGKHAEMVQVPKNLCARVPDNVSDEEAAFTVVAAIALQGLRLAQPELGETFVVTGLGLIGLITVQLLRAQGCRVLGIDPDSRKLALAAAFGAETVNVGNGEDPVAAAQILTKGRGVDGVLITAATQSNEPVHQAALMCRKRGRIVLVGVAGLQLSRDDFFKKELTFQVSCSYGPGRYDPEYEEGGKDYPVGYVRWTEQRNFEAVLDMMSSRRLDVKSLITHRFPFEDATRAYDLMQGRDPYLGILIEYRNNDAPKLRTRTIQTGAAAAVAKQTPSVGVIGAGQYGAKVLLPALKATGVRLAVVASSGGVSAAHAARKFGFAQASSDANVVLNDSSIDAVVIATRHDTHADLVCRALEAGKHVFVEKPLALHEEELDRIDALYQTLPTPPLLMVGFNRRFAPQVVKMKSLLAASKDRKSFVMTVNAGAIPLDHWTQGASGGGRIVGEGCHFVDLLRFLAGSPIVAGRRMGTGDLAVIDLEFADGSTGTVHYLPNGHKSFPKERLEVFCGGRILQLDNFRKLTSFGWPGFRKMNLWSQDKGQAHAMAAFVDAIREGKGSPIPLAELLEVGRLMVRLAH
jgi:predicted dehydrogenase/NADPH:quinone reductase-like Zn-dependent oxidoreductase